MIAEIQVLPTPSGNAAGRYAHVNAAIAVIESSGLTYEVGALGTTVEGRPDEVWALIRQVHEECLAAGADRVITVVKLAEGAGDQGPGIDDLTAKFRR